MNHPLKGEEVHHKKGKKNLLPQKARVAPSEAPSFHFSPFLFSLTLGYLPFLCTPKTKPKQWPTSTSSLILLFFFIFSYPLRSSFPLLFLQITKPPFFSLYSLPRKRYHTAHIFYFSLLNQISSKTPLDCPKRKPPPPSTAQPFYAFCSLPFYCPENQPPHIIFIPFYRTKGRAPHAAAAKLSVGEDLARAAIF